MSRGKFYSLWVFAVSGGLGLCAPFVALAQPGDPTSIDVPCSDASKPDAKDAQGRPSDLVGPPEFGQRACDVGTGGVRAEIKSHLDARLGNVVAYFYDGMLVDFTDKSSSGLCKIADVEPAVCEIGTVSDSAAEKDRNSVKDPDPLGQSCGMRGVTSAPMTDRQCFSSRPLDPRGCGASRINFARMQDQFLDGKVAEKRKCGEDCEDELNALLRNRANDVWLTDQYLQAWQKYVGNPNDVDGPSNYCAFSSRGVDLSTCRKEFAWMSGMRVSTWELYREEVFRELGTGKLAITSFGTDAPCAQLAVNYNKLLDGDPADIATSPGIRFSENEVRKRYGVVTGQLNTNVGEGCLGLENDVFNGEQDARDKAEKRIRAQFVAVDGAMEQESKRISHAVCSLAVARYMAQAAFTKTAFCEIMMRAKKKYFEDFIKTENLFGRFKKEVIDPCVGYANDKGGFDCDAGCAMDEFYRNCYIKGRGGQFATVGVKNFFRAYSREKIPTTEPAPNKKLLLYGQPVGVADISSCAALSLAPFLGKRRRRLTSLRKKLVGWFGLMLAGLIVALTFVLGCDDDGGPPVKTQVVCPSTKKPVTDSGGQPVTCYPYGVNDGGTCMQQAIDQYCYPAEDNAAAPPSVTPEVATANEAIQTITAVRADDGNVVAQGGAVKPPADQRSGQSLAASAADRNKAGFKDIKPTVTVNTKGGGASPGNGADGTGNGGTSGGVAGGAFGAGGGSLLGSGSGSGSGGADGLDSGSGGRGSGAGSGIAGSPGAGGFESAGAAGVGGGGGGRSTSSDGSGDQIGTGSGSSELGGDAYLAKAGKLSLFEVVSRRYRTWSSSLPLTP